MRRLIAPIVMALALGAGGCRTHQGTYTVISDKSVEISRVDMKHMPLTRDVSATDGRFWFLFIPFGSAPRMNHALNDCLKDGKGDFMTSANTSSFWWTILLFSWESWRVEGDVGNSLGAGSREVVPNPETPPLVVPGDGGGVEHN